MPRAHEKPEPQSIGPSARFCITSPSHHAMQFFQEETMAFRIGDTAPDFEADTTAGRIRFHDWMDGQWTVLFSHPKDFTPVCTTELGVLARMEHEFETRGVKLIELSIDSVADHAK